MPTVPVVRKLSNGSTTAFTQPAPYTFGNVGRTLPDVRSPGMTNWDASLVKNTALAERVNLQFRAEAFNVTNTPFFWLPGTNLNDSTTFGNLVHYGAATSNADGFAPGFLILGDSNVMTSSKDADNFSKTLSGSAAGALASANPGRPAVGAQTKPNILIVMADQHRAGLTKRSGFPIDTWPALDRLAATGVAFDRAYTTAPRVFRRAREPPYRSVASCSSGPAEQRRLFRVFSSKDLFHVTKELGYQDGSGRKKTTAT